MYKLNTIYSYISVLRVSFIFCFQPCPTLARHLIDAEITTKPPVHLTNYSSAVLKNRFYGANVFITASECATQCVGA